MIFDSNYWKEARDCVTKLREWDPEFKLVVDSMAHRYAILETVPESRLERFESNNGITLPPDYRSFLTTFGAGGAGPNLGINDFVHLEGRSVRERFQQTESCDWPDEDDDPLWQFPGLLPIASLGWPTGWYIEINGPYPGTIWLGSHERFVRYQSFGTWYDSWLNRVENGLRAHHNIEKLIAANVTKKDLESQIPMDSFEYEIDGVEYLQFCGVPSAIIVQGDRPVAFDPKPLAIE